MSTASMSFTDIVRRSAEKNTVVRKYENELADYARLRNAIVHQSTDGRIIAVPCDEVVEKLSAIEKLLCTPPTIGEKLQERRIVSVEDSLSLRQADLLEAWVKSQPWAVKAVAQVRLPDTELPTSPRTRLLRIWTKERWSSA